MKISKFFQKVDDSFLKANNCIFKKYKPIKKIGFGSFGNIYLTKRIEDKKLFAMKTEKKNLKKKQLEEEAYFLYTLQGFGIPKFISYGRIKNYNILIETLLDKSLSELMNNQKTLNLKDVCLIGIQILDRLEWIHSKNIIYRDIKPENFLIGKEDPNVIYIIDFGMCKKYRSSKTGKHILPKKTGVIDGTIKYLSLHILRGKEASRRDDLIALGYMLIYLYKGSLPWDTEMKQIYAQIYKKFFFLKSTNSKGSYFNKLPKEFVEYINYNNNLKFEQDPDYKYLRSLFNAILFRLKFNFKNMSFSWIISNQINLLTIPRNNSMRKSNYHSRLFQKIIENSEQRSKNESISNNIANTNYILNNSSMDKFNIINNVKSENNILIKNNEKMISIQRNENGNNKSFKIKNKIFQKKLDNSNSAKIYNKRNYETLTNNLNNSNNCYITNIKNSISNNTIDFINPNRIYKDNLFIKNQNNLRKKNNYSNKQESPKKFMSNNNSNIKKYQSIFNSKINNLKNSNNTNRNYFLYHSNKNYAKGEKKIKNNINNSSLKTVIQKKDFKIISPNQFNNYKILSNRIKKSPIYSSLNIDNDNYFIDKSNKNQNENLVNKNIKIIYVNNNYNYLRNTNSISHFPNKNITNKERKFSLQMNKNSKYMNLKNKIISSQSPFSNSNIKLNKNITYKSKFKRNEEDKSLFSEYKTSIISKYFENN